MMTDNKNTTETMDEMKKCTRCGMPLEFGAVNTFTTRAQYGSVFDGADITIDLCPECLDKLIASCQVPPFTNLDDETDDDEMDLLDMYGEALMAVRDDWKDLHIAISKIKNPVLMLAEDRGDCDEGAMLEAIQVEHLGSFRPPLDDEYGNIVASPWPTLTFDWGDAAILIANIDSVNVVPAEPNDWGEVYRVSIIVCDEPKFVLFVCDGDAMCGSSEQ